MFLENCYEEEEDEEGKISQEKNFTKMDKYNNPLEVINSSPKFGIYVNNKENIERKISFQSIKDYENFLRNGKMENDYKY